MIKSISSQNSITLFWDKKENCLYEIKMGEEESVVTKATHCTFNLLRPETEYTVSVKAKNIISGEEILFVEKTVLTSPEKKRIDVTKPPYLAVGDGKTLNTKYLQKAIDDCKAGEYVYIPEGVFLTGALRLHSNMELYIDKGAVLQGTENPVDYLPKIKSRFEGLEMECYSALLNMGELNRNGGFNCENVVITGGGEISGGGRVLAENVINAETERLKDYLEALGDKIKEYEFPKTIPGRARPRLINISNCKNIILSDITIKNGPSWNVHMIYSDNVITHNCFFYSQGVWNGDGWDPDSSTNCTIFNCEFNTGDDCIAIKSGKNPEGNQINKPCENIRIFDCKCIMGHGICIGSEMSGGVNNILIWDCDFKNSTVGIEIKATKKRGGYVRNIKAVNCRLPRIMMHSVPYNDDGEAAPQLPLFEECVFEKLVLTGEALYNDGKRKPCDIIELRGFDKEGHFIKNIKFKDLFIENLSGGVQNISMQYLKGVSFENINCM